MLSYLTLLLLPVLMILISIVYFRAASPSTPVWQRILVSAHGVTGAGLIALALFISATGNSRAEWGRPYAALLFLPFILIGISLLMFRGNAKVHMLIFPFVLVLFYWLMICGSFVTG